MTGGGGAVFSDGPTPYDSLEKWEQYLSWLETLPENTVSRQAMIERAEKKVAQIKKEGDAASRFKISDAAPACGGHPQRK